MNKKELSWRNVQQKLSKLSIPERIAWVKARTDKEKAFLKRYPECFLLDYQLIPEDNDWYWHWFCWARGCGKSLAGYIWLNGLIRDGAEEVAIVGPDHNTIKKEVLPTFTSILSLPITKQDLTAGIIEINKQCLVKLYSSEYEIRGCNAEYALAEEMAKWNGGRQDDIKHTWDILNAGVRNRRAKPHPRILNVSTPKPFDILKDWVRQADAGNKAFSYSVATIDDARFISEEKKEQDKISTPLRLKRQELYAEILTDNPNALWSEELIAKCRISKVEFNNLLTSNPPKLKVLYQLITIDPSVSNNKYSDECGIIRLALCSDNNVYVMEDCSGKMSDSAWSLKAVNLYNTNKAFAIVIEKNQGGTLNESVIKNVDPYARVILEHTKDSKAYNLQRLAGAYELGQVRHVGDYPLLEKQMLEFDPLMKDTHSPDRADAVWMGVYSMLMKQRAAPARSLRALGAL